MNQRHPYFPLSSELHKNVNDWANFKALYNPAGNLKEAFQEHNFIDAVNRSAGIGEAGKRDNVVGYAKATFDPTYVWEYKSPSQKAAIARMQTQTQQAAASAAKTASTGKTLLQGAVAASESGNPPPQSSKTVGSLLQTSQLTPNSYQGIV